MRRRKRKKSGVSEFDRIPATTVMAPTMTASTTVTIPRKKRKKSAGKKLYATSAIKATHHPREHRRSRLHPQEGPRLKLQATEKCLHPAPAYKTRTEKKRRKRKSPSPQSKSRLLPSSGSARTTSLSALLPE